MAKKSAKSQSKVMEQTQDADNHVSNSTIELNKSIRQRAYEIYLEKGNSKGSDLLNWLQAEKEMLGQSASSFSSGNKKGKK